MMQTDKNVREARTANSPASKMAFAIGGVTCSADSFVVAESSVLRMNICLQAGRFVVKSPPIANLQNVGGKRRTTENSTTN